MNTETEKPVETAPLPEGGHVIIAMADMQEELAKIGIAKDKEGEHKSKIRGIDDIRNTIAPLQRKCHLQIIPYVTNVVSAEFSTKSGGRAVHRIMYVDFHFISTKDGSKVVVPGIGEAIDYADKAVGKALSYAYKNMCINAFNIPTEGEEDTDLEKGKDLQAGSQVQNPGIDKTQPRMAYAIDMLMTADGKPEYDDFVAELEIKIPMMQTVMDVSTLNRANSKWLREIEKERPDLFKHVAELFRAKSQSLM